MKITSMIALALVIVGAINWLLVGLFAFDLVAFLFGSMTIVTRIVYSLVGLAGLWTLFYWIVYSPFDRVAAHE